MRSVFVAYENRAEFATLSEKLEHAFQNHFIPGAGKNKAKTPEEEVGLSVRSV